MGSLPVELEIAVCEHLESGDLASVARTSKHFLAVAQPILYRDVEVDDVPVNDISPIDTQYTDPSSLRMLHSTLLGRERDLGPLIKSLHIRSLFFSVPWKELAPFFLAMRNLLVFRIGVIYCINDTSDKTFNKHILPAVAPTLRELHTDGIDAFPQLIHFIDTHPNITVLDVAGREWALEQAEDVRTISESPGLARLQRFTVTHQLQGGFGCLFDALKSMTGLTHLSISVMHNVDLDDADFSNLQGAFVRCGANLVELSLLSEAFNRLGWIIRNILPWTPSLRRFRIELLEKANIVSYTLTLPAGHQVLPALETIIWSVLPDAMSMFKMQDKSNRTFSDAVLKIIETFFHLFPSLRKVEYTEWSTCSAACFRLLGDGKIEQEPMEFRL